MVAVQPCKTDQGKHNAHKTNHKIYNSAHGLPPFVKYAAQKNVILRTKILA